MKRFLFNLLLIAGVAPTLNAATSCIRSAADVSGAPYATTGDGKTQNTPELITSASYGDAEGVRALLAAGADVNIRDRYGSTALISATRNAYMQVVTVLLADLRTDVNARDTLYGKSALMYAADAGWADIVAALLADQRITPETVNARDVNGKTALDIAKQSHKTALAITKQHRKTTLVIDKQNSRTITDLTQECQHRIIVTMIQDYLAAHHQSWCTIS